MNTIKNFGLKLTLMLVALLSINVAYAQYDGPKLSVGTKNTLTFDSYETVNVPIAMENSVEVGCLQFYFLLPAELEFADGMDTEAIINPERLDASNNIIIFSPKTGRVGVTSMDTKSNIKGKSGDIMYIPVKVKEGMLSSGKTLDINITDIQFVTPDGQTVLGKQPDFVVRATLDPFSYTGFLTPDPFTVAPGKSAVMDFCLTNVYTGTDEEAPVVALSFNIALPEGLTISNIVPSADRLFSRANVSYDEETGNIVLADISMNKPLKSGHVGEPLFSFTVNAAEDFVAEDAEIKLSQLQVAAVVGSTEVNGVTKNCAITNTAIFYANEEAYEAVIADINDVKTKYDEALAAAKEANPNYDFAEWEEIITNAINEAANGAAQALAAANEDVVEFNFTFNAEDIEAMIEEMQKAAAQDSLETANKAAYDEVVAEIDAVEAKYDEALAAAKEANPDYDFSEWEETIGNAIEEAKTGALQALNAANEDGEEYAFAFTGEDIEAMIAEMQAASDKDILATANEAAYKEVEKAINDVEAEYNAAIAEIEENYPAFDLTEWKEIIGNAIDEAKTGAQQALNAANEDGEEFAFEFTGEDIQNMIAEMKAEAEHSNLVAGNQAAYEIVLEAIKKAEADYNTAVAEIEENYPDYDLTDWKALIENALSEAATGAEQALNAANEDGEEFTFAFDGEDIEAMINEMKAAPAKAALEAANKVAYDKVYAQIVVLEGEYLTAIAEIQENHPDYDVTEWKEIIENAINEAKTGAQQALDSANEDGVEFTFAFDGEEIQAMIDEMLEDMQTSAISAIEAEVEAGNASIYTLDGRKQSSLVRGAVNIIMRGNTTTKMYIRK